METHTKKAAGKASEALAHFPFPVSPRAFEIAVTAQTHDGETGFTGAGSQCQNLRWWQNACQGSGITGRICPNEKWLPLLTSKLLKETKIKMAAEAGCLEAGYAMNTIGR